MSRKKLVLSASQKAPGPKAVAVAEDVKHVVLAQISAVQLELNRLRDLVLRTEVE